MSDLVYNLWEFDLRQSINGNFVGIISSYAVLWANNWSWNTIEFTVLQYRRDLFCKFERGRFKNNFNERVCFWALSLRKQADLPRLLDRSIAKANSYHRVGFSAFFIIALHPRYFNDFVRGPEVVLSFPLSSMKGLHLTSGYQECCQFLCKGFQRQTTVKCLWYFRKGLLGERAAFQLQIVVQHLRRFSHCVLSTDKNKLFISG